jgi:enoyl-CoA hydratase/carnithine racemase
MSCPDRPERGACVQHWREGAIARIHFNRPQALNAIDTAVAAGFLCACEDIAADVGVRAVWVSGEGRAFMAGGVRRRRGGSYLLQHLYEHFGLVRRSNLKHGGSWAKA